MDRQTILNVRSINLAILFSMNSKQREPIIIHRAPCTKPREKTCRRNKLVKRFLKYHIPTKKVHLLAKELMVYHRV